MHQSVNIHDDCIFLSKQTSFPPLDNIRVMVIVWRLRGNIIRTVLCWIVWHNVQSAAVMGKSKSWFDLNHDWITGNDLISVQKIWFGNMWFDKSQLSIIWAKGYRLLCWCFYCSWVNSTIPNLCRDIDSQARCTVHWLSLIHIWPLPTNREV